MAPKYILEQFLQQELLINITEHEVHTPLFTLSYEMFPKLYCMSHISSVF